MGHVRLGRLPASKKWRQVVGYLLSGDADVAGLANQVAEASARSLQKVATDRGLIEAIWLLIQVPRAAKQQDFQKALRGIGLDVPCNPSVADIVAAYDAAVRRGQRKLPWSASDLGEMARAAGVSALAGLLEERLPPLWQAGSEDIRTTLATFSNPERFADLTHRFFSALLDRNLHYFVDRELPRHVGREGLVRSAGGLSQFDRAMQQHCEESTFIMRAYARDWLGKNVFKEQRRLTERDVIAFASIALTKLGKELSVRSRPD